MNNDNDKQPGLGNGGGAVVPSTNERDDEDTGASGASDQTERLKALYDWADQALEDAGVFKTLRNAKAREELEGIKFDPGHPALIMAIHDARNSGEGNARKKHFKHLTAKMLESILRNRFANYKKEQNRKLIENEQQAAAEEEAREKRDEIVKFYGDFGQYKVRDLGVFVRVDEELETGETLIKWVQISRTRIELMAVTRSKQDDAWGVYVKIVNMDGRPTRLAIPRHIINDLQGNIAGRLADLGVDVVREQRDKLPDFLLSTVEVVDDNVQELTRFMAVPTTGWYQLNNGQWVFVLPHTTKFPADLAAGELAIFQNENLHLEHGFAIEGSVEDWREQILEPFSGNSNVTLSVGSALAGPITERAGVPPGFYHEFCKSKRAKSIVSAIGQSIYGLPVIPGETVADPFGTSWLATANSLGELVKIRSSIGAFCEELTQGKEKDIADAIYRIANGVTKARLRGGKLEPRLTYCVPGFSTGEVSMVEFLSKAGVKVTEGMQTRFADIPAEPEFDSGTVFEKFSADEVPTLGAKFYALLKKLYGAVGDRWLQHLVDMGPDQIEITVKAHQQEFRSRPKVRALYAVAAPYQRSVIDRFATVAAACRMATDADLLWKHADSDADIEACMLRWAKHEQMNTTVAAIARFMGDRPSWQGSATQLKAQLDGAVESAEALGRWLRKTENLKRLKLAGFKVVKGKAKSRDRSRLICIDRVGVE
jgi:uncharacterized protein (DUF927 family)